ncbi:hypothetical protein HDV01_003787, partial [Terramyces sp. JEL0728]
MNFLKLVGLFIATAYSLATPAQESDSLVPVELVGVDGNPGGGNRIDDPTADHDVTDIKKIKFSVIEKYFTRKIVDNIDEDVKLASKMYLFTKLKLTITQGYSTVLSCMIFVIYSFLGNAITPSVVFPTYLYLDTISSQVTSLKDIFANVLNIYEGYQLVADYLLAEEFVDVTQKSEDSDFCCDIRAVFQLNRIDDPTADHDVTDIKKIKFSVIEKYFTRKIVDNIDEDVKLTAKMYLFTKLKLTITQGYSTVLSCMIFVIYSFLGNAITPSVVFPTYLYLDTISSQVTSLKDIFAN